MYGELASPPILTPVQESPAEDRDDLLDGPVGSINHDMLAVPWAVVW